MRYIDLIGLNEWMILEMGGNAFKDPKVNELVTRIKREEIDPTLHFIAGLLKIPNIDYEYLKSHMMGSTGKQADSGDIDIAVNAEQPYRPFMPKLVIAFPKSVLNNIAAIVKQKLGDQYVVTSGLPAGQLNTAIPIMGKIANGLVQVDFIHGDADWLKFSHFSPGKDVSPYKGVWISTMLGVLAKMKKIWQWPQHDVEKPTDRLARAGWSYDLEQGLKISAKAQKKSGMGMSEMDPDEWESYVGKKWPESNPPRLPRVGYIKTPDDVVRILIGDGVTPKHIQTFEDLWNVVKRKSLDGDGTIPFTSEQIKQRFAEALVRSSTGKDFKNLDEILNASVFQDKKAA